MSTLINIALEIIEESRFQLSSRDTYWKTSPSSCFLFKTIRDPVSARTAFEKLTDYDYRGTTYYSVRNLSLYECQGWCREEAECQAAAFSFVVNPLAPMQDTLCQLQNETAATNPAAQPQRAANMYYMTKLQIRSGTWIKFQIYYFSITFISHPPFYYLRTPARKIRPWTA